MLFPSIETGTDMNARESENYLPINVDFVLLALQVAPVSHIIV
jgi:hypothetical protein